MLYSLFVTPVAAFDRSVSASRVKLSQTPVPWLFALGVGAAAYGVWVTDPERIAVLPGFLTVVTTWTMLLVVTVLRHPYRQLRMSEPAVPIFGWMFYYFIKPMFAWLAGRRFAFEHPSTVILEPALVSRLQVLHVLFMLSFFGVYFSLAPKVCLVPPFRSSEPAAPPRVRWLVLLGLLPYLYTAIERLVSTGTILPTRTYGSSTFESYEALLASRAVGGADYLLTQIFAKIWFFPILALGIGYGITFARYVVSGSWLLLALFFAQIPALFLLGPGSRSYSIYPFIIAIMIGDLLAGPLRWRYLLVLIAIGLPVFEFYGVARSYQDQGIREAFESSQQVLAERGELVDTEDSGMLVKEAFCVVYADHTRTTLGAEYFLNNVLQLLPMQLIPDKVQFWNTSNFLGQQFLGSAASRGAGMAGTAIGDGYLIGQEFGLVLLAAVYGLIPAVMQRLVMLHGRSRGPIVWRYLLVLTFSVHAPQFIRADLCILLNAAIFWLAFPALMVLAAEQTVIPRSSFWRRPLAPLQ